MVDIDLHDKNSFSAWHVSTVLLYMYFALCALLGRTDFCTKGDSSGKRVGITFFYISTNVSQIVLVLGELVYSLLSKQLVA